jgi:membrane associated rhomboid family serine protease
MTNKEAHIRTIAILIILFSIIGVFVALCCFFPQVMAWVAIGGFFALGLGVTYNSFYQAHKSSGKHHK